VRRFVRDRQRLTRPGAAFVNRYFQAYPLDPATDLLQGVPVTDAEGLLSSSSALGRPAGCPTPWVTADPTACPGGLTATAWL